MEEKACAGEQPGWVAVQNQEAQGDSQTSYYESTGQDIGREQKAPHFLMLFILGSPSATSLSSSTDTSHQWIVNICNIRSLNKDVL